MTRRDWIARSSGVAVLLQTQAGCGPMEGDRLPKFHAKSLTGQRFDNAGIKDKVLLVQFWATWCGYCRGDQTPVDRITREFEPQGLIVLAVNVGETRDKVVDYLRATPRACHIVMQEDTNLVSIFRASGFPKYVIANRKGIMAGEQNGAGGMLALRELLAGADLRS
jgi:cytochrome c-type biogenesis protein